MTAVETLAHSFAAHANPIAAGPMKDYMRGQFEFYGIKSDLRRGLSKDFIRSQQDPEIIRALWAYPQREMHQVGIDLLMRLAKKLTPGDVPVVHYAITTHSWWDTVDALAVNVMGRLCRNHPELIQSHLLPWSTHPDFWLRRTAILFQLKYKHDLDTELLTEIILRNLGSDEFFINKAIGWVLREHSRIDPDFVACFVEDHDLAPLSKREALKHIS